MPDAKLENRKHALERYLDQIKVLSALATALLLTPAIIQAISKGLSASGQPDARLVPTKVLALAANITFLCVIVCSYLIYSSLVGEIHRGTYDIYRKATRVFSLLQIAFLLLGLVLLSVVFYRLF